MYTNQSAFDAMVAHLRSMPEAATNYKGDCRYRTDDGRKCAVGALIPDAEYRPDFEGKSAGRIARRLPSVFAEVSPFVLDAVQDCHDDVREWGPSGFIGERALKRIAEHYGLTYTPPTPAA